MQILFKLNRAIVVSATRTHDGKLHRITPSAKIETPSTNANAVPRTTIGIGYETATKINAKIYFNSTVYVCVPRIMIEFSVASKWIVTLKM